MLPSKQRLLDAFIRRYNISFLDYLQFEDYAWRVNARYAEFFVVLTNLIAWVIAIFDHLVLVKIAPDKIFGLDLWRATYLATGVVGLLLLYLIRENPRYHTALFGGSFVGATFVSMFVISGLGGFDEPWVYSLIFIPFNTSVFLFSMTYRLVLNMAMATAGIAAIGLAHPEHFSFQYAPVYMVFVYCSAFFSFLVGSWHASFLRMNHAHAWELHEAYGKLNEQREAAIRFADEKAHEASVALLSLNTARAEERQHIARELHDELGHRIVAHHLTIEGFRTQPHPDPQDQQVGEQLARELIEIEQGARKVVQNLRLAALEHRLASSLVEQELQQLRARQQFNLEVLIEPEEMVLPEHLLPVVYRVLQESLTNIQKYSGARAVEVSLLQQGRDLVVSIRDDGRGFDPAAVQRGFGLIGMSERVTGVGGTLQVLTSPGQGCEILVTLPYSQEEAEL